MRAIRPNVPMQPTIHNTTRHFAIDDLNEGLKYNKVSTIFELPSMKEKCNSV